MASEIVFFHNLMHTVSNYWRNCALELDCRILWSSISLDENQYLWFFDFWFKIIYFQNSNSIMLTEKNKVANNDRKVVKITDNYFSNIIPILARNSQKFSFTNIWGLRPNFVECESFLESTLLTSLLCMSQTFTNQLTLAISLWWLIFL